MSRKELLCWYFAMCECIIEDNEDYWFNYAFYWADDLYEAMDRRTKNISKRYDKMMEHLMPEEWNHAISAY